MSKIDAYLIGHIRVKNPAKWAEYRTRVPATLAPWGGERVLRGKLAEVMNGSHDYTDTVVLRFPDLAALNGWYHSAAYQAIIPFRNEAADVVLIACEESD